MKRFWNSLQFRLYGTFSVVIMLIALLVITGTYYHNLSFDRNDQTREVSRLSTNAYLLLTLSHRYIDVDTADEQAPIKLQIDEVLANTELVLSDLKNGSLERDTPALDIESLVILRDQIQSELIEVKPRLEAMYASEPTESEYEAAVQLVDDVAAIIPEHANQLLEEVDSISDQEKITGEAITSGIALALAIMLIIASITVLQSVRAIEKLAKTAESFAYGDFKIRANTQTLTELSVVGNTFNQMADQISELIVNLEHQVTLAEEARARAEQSDQVKSSFLANMSHELRTPLNAIINFSKFVIKGVMGPVTDQQVDALNKVVHSGKHLLNLINDVLDISKIESGSMNLFLEPNINISEIIKQTGELSEALLEGKPVRMDVEIASNIPTITGDRQRLRQILTNVISNACKFTDEGIIKICAAYKNNNIHISIQDTGPGIAAEDYNLVFESFKQTGSGLRQGNGTGLGMPISKKLTEAFGGKLWFESEVGKGSTFFIEIPVKIDEQLPIAV